MNFAFARTVYNDTHKKNMEKSESSDNMNVKTIGDKTFLINPFKDERCSYKCYLNWVLFDMLPPRFHSCKCTEKRTNK